MNTFKSVFLIMIASIAFVGCVPHSNAYYSDPAVRSSMEQIRTNDLQVIRERWGAYTDIVEKTWVLDIRGVIYWRDFRWILPGAVIGEFYATCENGSCTKGERYLQYDMVNQRIERFGSKGEFLDYGKVYSNNRVFFGPFSTESIQYDLVNKKFIVDIWTFDETTGDKLTEATGFSRKTSIPSQQNSINKPSKQSFTSNRKDSAKAVVSEGKITSTKAISTSTISKTNRSNIKVSNTKSTTPVKMEASTPANQSDTGNSNMHSSTLSANNFILGSYQVEGGSYRIQIEQRNGDLIVREPNKTSTYKRQADGTYHYYNEKNDITYGLRILDGQTIEAFKPFQDWVEPTRLTLTSKRLSPSAGPNSAKGDAISAITRKYEALAKSEPSNAHVWAFCASVAQARAVMNDTEFLKYEKISIEMIKPIMSSQSNPCPDAIPHW